MNDKFTDEELSDLFGEIPQVEIDDELNAIIAEFSGKKPETAVRELPARREKPRKVDPPAALPEPIPEKKPKGVGYWVRTVLKVVATLAASVISVVLTVSFLEVLLLGTGVPSKGSAEAADRTIMDSYDMYMTNQVSNALDGVLAIEKVYWLNDHDLIAPEPNPNGYGKTTDPTSLQWLLDEASALLGIDEFVFSTDIKTIPGSEINYYLDETIFAITWRESIHNSAYTFAEVKIAHPSQFRRFLADGEFGSDKLYVTTEMAQSVNAVLATSGDYYRFRHNGAVVYEGQLRRFEGEKVDTCFINDDGDLLFAYRGDLTSEAQAKKFVEENNVRFSMAFGPILVDEGEVKVPKSYLLGEINDQYSRAGLAQMDELHYLVVSAGGEGGNENRHTVMQFAENIRSFGAKKAYALDGGQTTVVAMDGKLINNVDFGFQRQISDIIYFATANPEVK